jgi:hypothetical protein
MRVGVSSTDEAAVAGVLRAGAHPGEWIVVDAGGHQVALDPHLIVSAHATDERTTSPEVQTLTAVLGEQAAIAARERSRLAELQIQAENRAAADRQRLAEEQATAEATAAEQRRYLLEKQQESDARASSERQQMLEKQQAAEARASTERQQMFALQQQQQQALAALADAVARLSASRAGSEGASPPARQPPPQLILGSPPPFGSQTGEDVGRALATLARREEKTFSSHRLEPDDELLAVHRQALLALPAYKWPKSDHDLPEIRRCLAKVAVASADVIQSVTAFLQSLRPRLELRNVALTIAQAEIVLSALAMKKAGGLSANMVAAVAELVLLTDERLRLHYSTMVIARQLRPALEGDLRALSLSQLTRLGGEDGVDLPVRVVGQTSTDASATPGPRGDRPRTCRFCGSSHTGAWATHTCSGASRSSTPLRTPTAPTAAATPPDPPRRRPERQARTPSRPRFSY